MNRRTYLVAVTAALAGCGTGDDGTDPANGPDETTAPAEGATTAPSTETGGASAESAGSETPTDSATPSPTPTPNPGEFRIVSFSVPDRAEIGEEVTYVLSVENVADEGAEFEATVEGRPAGGSPEPLGTHSRRIGPDRTVNFTGDPFTHRVVGEYRLRVQGFEETFPVEFVPATLSFGESYTAPTGVRMTVPEVTSTTEYDDEDGEAVEASAGYKWAFVGLRCVNDGDDAADAPPRDAVSLAVQGDTYHPQPYEGDDEYAGGSLDPGDVREGVIRFEIPVNATTSELTVEWSGTFDGGTAAVSWVESA